MESTKACLLPKEKTFDTNSINVELIGRAEESQTKDITVVDGIIETMNVIQNSPKKISHAVTKPTLNRVKSTISNIPQIFMPKFSSLNDNLIKDNISINRFSIKTAMSNQLDCQIIEPVLSESKEESQNLSLIHI